MNPASGVYRFLEPVYLNEKVALNCAAYLFVAFAYLLVHRFLTVAQCP